MGGGQLCPPGGVPVRCAHPSSSDMEALGRGAASPPSQTTSLRTEQAVAPASRHPAAGGPGSRQKWAHVDSRIRVFAVTGIHR
jgi:hypothetical protein